jgi:predicted Zn-dependent protease
MEDEALEYINYAKANNLLFNDSYLESYLYSLAYKIYPSRIGDGRPGILNIKISKDTDPNAFVYPNGTMFLTTGLLSAISSEEELIGVMAHEISHFVLDHSIININKADQRKKRAEFWANIATGVALAAELYTASNDEYYVPGAFTVSKAIIPHTFAAQFNERMGLKFSREQEVAADICAKNLMRYIHIDPTSLSSVLSKIKTYNIKNGNYFALTGKGTHPSIDYRISKIGDPTSDFKSIDYDRTVSFVNSFNAIIEFNNHHLEQCAKLVNRNIKANVATEGDYILLALVTTYMFDNKEKNLEALSYINKAKGLNVVPDITVYKQEAIIQIRLKQNQKAKLALSNYLESLDKQYLGHTEYIIKEKEWTLKMINKVSNM